MSPEAGRPSITETTADRSHSTLRRAGRLAVKAAKGVVIVATGPVKILEVIASGLSEASIKADREREERWSRDWDRDHPDSDDPVWYQ